jgi:hypothetical protein
MIFSLVLLTGFVQSVRAQQLDQAETEDLEMLLVGEEAIEDEAGNFKAYAQTPTCLQVFPSKIRGGRMGRLGLLIISGPRTFQRGEIVDWGTDDIITIFRFRFPQRIYSIVWIVRFPEEGIFEVIVGNDDNCTGEIQII